MVHQWKVNVFSKCLYFIHACECASDSMSQWLLLLMLFLIHIIIYVTRALWKSGFFHQGKIEEDQEEKSLQKVTNKIIGYSFTVVVTVLVTSVNGFTLNLQKKEVFTTVKCKCDTFHPTHK